MSRERARAREAREAGRAQERAKAARAPERRQKAGLRPPVPRRRAPRYGAMPRKTRLALGFGLLVVQFVGWQVLSGATQRVGLFLLSLLALPLVVTLFIPKPTSSSRSSR